ncbi:cupin domain-containing protein [Streptomyces sp. NPDC085614]|uniref:cupin domain-containing protein n=1 Tax=Streptomyces sp. NPDC085614 TaxID=3365733 RepID=UPI0037D45C25
MVSAANDGPEGPDRPSSAPVAHVLCDTAALATIAPGRSGAVWRLAESGRQLDANVVSVPPGGRVETHVEPELDVLLLVVAGDGTLLRPDEPLPLGEGSLVWLPHGAIRGLAAGARGLAYLTVHTRRPGMRIGGVRG